MEAKFLGRALRVMPRDRAARLAETIWQMEDVADVTDLLDAATAHTDSART